ncbi:D-alanyl-D-alanine carboxypeptidase family protein [Phenylobacterium soli]|uniref:D-alanyl-D-alanine carboxypeptidase family protein n=1 Tax=Phenylobacterium soli TaxID=2170551 RepID=UPI00105776AD|nr:D-alanyl-D-alanine carboxypeptidase family protein [Phenylobacterium soli]
MSLKPSDVGRFLLALLAVAAIGLVVVVRVTHRPAARPPASPAQPPSVASASAPQACDPPAWRAAAQANARSLATLAWSPFGRAESGWRIYAAAVGRLIGSTCPPDTAGFAAAYGRWQQGQTLAPDGVFKPEEFERMKNRMALERPFVQFTSKGLCPGPPPPQALEAATAAEGYGGKVVSLRRGALAAYRRMVADARADGAVAGADDFKLISGYRGPEEEAARCADGGCNTVSKASCSAHRTGLAADIFLGRAAGSDPVSTDEANRKAIVATPAYRWLVTHADRYGFLNYPFEPWHWEWTGEPP